MFKKLLSWATVVGLTAGTLFAAAPAFSQEVAKNHPAMVEADGRLRFDFGDEFLVLEGGLQPSLLRTATGALIVQAQIPKKPVPTERMHSPWALGNVISRDDGKTWTVVWPIHYKRKN